MTEIQIDATFAAAGEYEIILESFDAASSVKSALKTDKVTVKVTPIAPSMSSEPELVVLSPEESSEWSLPTINPGSYGPATVLVTIPATLSSVITFDQDSKTFTFDGLSASSTLAGQSYLFRISLESSEDDWSKSYTQMVQILAFENAVAEKAQVGNVPAAQPIATPTAQVENVTVDV